MNRHWMSSSEARGFSFTIALPQLLWGIVHHIPAQISCRATLSLRADTLGFFAPQWVAGGSFSERQSVFERSGYRFA